MTKISQNRHISNIQLPAHLSRVYEPPKALPCCSQTCTDIWGGYTGHQKTAHQKQIRQVESEFDMEIVSLIVQQLHAGVISLLALMSIWLILLNPVTNIGVSQNNKSLTAMLG